MCDGMCNQLEFKELHFSVKSLLLNIAGAILYVLKSTWILENDFAYEKKSLNVTFAVCDVVTYTNVYYTVRCSEDIFKKQ